MAFVMDFSDPDAQKPPLEFVIDGERFHATAVCPAGALQDMAVIAELGREKKIAEMLNKLGEFLGMVLLPESLQRFNARLRSAERPVTQVQLTKLVQWLMEEYAGRPTAPASSSQTGQVATDPSSTVGVSPTVSPGDVWTSLQPAT